MKTKLEFTTNINAPREKVWRILWDDATYRHWTSAFQEGSYAVSDWKEGSKIQFLTPEGDGMYSIIERSEAPELMSFKHLGILKEGNELPLDEETKQWEGAHENYELRQDGDQTILNVSFESINAYREYFQNTFPKALDIVKSLSEK
ncbi:MAG: SRPBCC domain-containing protein [Candidatus Kapaibacterium sp.]